jgi:alginate O-acetyltransferase complex protein AlgI
MQELNDYYGTGGLWHGAGILFLLWGVWHGAVLVLYRLVPIDKYLATTLGRLGNCLSIVLTFHIVCFGWILFRAQTDTLLPLLSSIAELFTATNLGLWSVYGRGVAFLGLVVLATDYIGYRRNVEFQDLFQKWSPYLAGALAVICYFAITIVGKREAAQFIYFQF